MDKIYLKEGTRLIVRRDRQVIGGAIGVSQRDNGGSVQQIPDTTLLQLFLGPALVEDLGTNHKEVWELLNKYGPTYKALYHEVLYPHTYRYTLRDSQRFLFIAEMEKQEETRQKIEQVLTKLI
jgi:hypothetical protein